LAGGNPQIAKGHGDEAVRAYLAAMPGWKREVGRRLDNLITHAIPDVRKAVKYNSPLYGLDDEHWFLSFRCFARYVKVTFFRGAKLQPVPDVRSKVAGVRYLHIDESEPLDEARFISWVKQASKLPGNRL